MDDERKKLPQDNARNVYSQYGEDGILEYILSKLNIQNGFCCEFGAWDGKKYSNTFNLIENKGWSGLLIEGSQKRYEQLIKNIMAFTSVKAINETSYL